MTATSRHPGMSECLGGFMVAEGRVDGYKAVESAGRVAREQTGGAKEMGVEIRVIGKQELRAEKENERF